MADQTMANSIPPETLERFKKARKAADRVIYADNQVDILKNNLTPENAPGRLSTVIVQTLKQVDQQSGGLEHDLLLALGIAVLNDILAILPFELAPEQQSATLTKAVEKWAHMRPDTIPEEMRQQVAQQPQEQQRPAPPRNPSQQPQGLLGGM